MRPAPRRDRRLVLGTIRASNSPARRAVTAASNTVRGTFFEAEAVGDGAAHGSA
jgi:hypothetical protein